MILITGGAGYIGAHVNKALNKEGKKTLVIDNLITGHQEFCRWGEFVRCDLQNAEQLEKVFSEYPIEAVIHFAAFAQVGESIMNPEKYYLNNVNATLKLLQVMRKNRVKNIVVSSSAAVFGATKKSPISEDQPKNPINPYGKTKLIMEQILEDYAQAYGIQYVALRYFNAAGADPECEIGEWHEPETHLIPLVLDVAHGVSPTVKIFGADYRTPDKTCIRDYIHVTDLAQAHILALQYLTDGGKSTCFNLGNGNGFSVKKVIQAASRVTGKKIKFIASERRAGDPARLVADSRRAKKILGWKPKHSSLNEIIETAWAWHQKLHQFRSYAAF